MNTARWGCFKEQRYKLFESNSQQKEGSVLGLICCFKEQRYKLFESNSQHFQSLSEYIISCFKEQRYKLSKCSKLVFY